MNLKQISKSVSKYTAKHMPGILAGAAIAGVVATAIAVAKTAPEVHELIQKEKEENGKVSKEAKIKVAKLYFPAALSGALTITCIIASNYVSYKHKVMLTSVATASQAALLEYKDNAKKLLGERKVTEIEEEAVKDKVLAADTTRPVRTGYGDELCMEAHTGQIFYGDPNYIWNLWRNIGDQMQAGGEASLHDWLIDLGLETTSISPHLGWELDYENDKRSVSLIITPAYTKNGELVHYISHSRDPEWID